jgi:ankyrin repeat protein
MSRRLTSASSLDSLKKAAKRWLRALRAGDEAARARLLRVHPGAAAAVTLRDVQFALAREHGVAGWAALREHFGMSSRRGPFRPPEMASERPYGEWSSRGCDVWEAIEAARTGDAAALRTLLARDPNVARYREPLRFAAREGHLDVVRLLLDAGAPVDMLGPGNETVATIARDRGHESVAALIEAAARPARTVPAQDAPEHAIHVAAAWNNVGAIHRLLDADPGLLERGDRKGGTPLHRAVLAAARDAIVALLDRGADIHALHGDGPGDAAGYAPANYQPIDLALFWRLRRDLETARLLLGRGAARDLTIASALGDAAEVAAALDRDPACIGSARPMGKRPLAAAVEFGHQDIVRLLLRRGADPTWPEGADAPRGSALHTAARAGHREIVELLLDHGADPSAYVDAAGNATWAAKTPELRKYLISRGGKLDCYDLVWLDEDDEVVRRVKADPREADAGCGGVFTAAATRHKRDLVVRLLEAGARVPPVLTACRSYLTEDLEILRLLLAHGMNPDLPDWQRATLLHELCGRDARDRAHDQRVAAAAVLLDAGASISAKDEEYRSTPLAWAARNNLPDMVEFLLARGAPTNLPDDEPWATPLAWAERRGHRQIAERLRRAGAVS